MSDEGWEPIPQDDESWEPIAPPSDLYVGMPRTGGIPPGWEMVDGRLVKKSPEADIEAANPLYTEGTHGRVAGKRITAAEKPIEYLSEWQIPGLKQVAEAFGEGTKHATRFLMTPGSTAEGGAPEVIGQVAAGLIPQTPLDVALTAGPMAAGKLERNAVGMAGRADAAMKAAQAAQDEAAIAAAARRAAQAQKVAETARTTAQAAEAANLGIAAPMAVQGAGTLGEGVYEGDPGQIGRGLLQAGMGAFGAVQGLRAFRNLEHAARPSVSVDDVVSDVSSSRRRAELLRGMEERRAVENADIVARAVEDSHTPARMPQEPLPEPQARVVPQEPAPAPQGLPGKTEEVSPAVWDQLTDEERRPFVSGVAVNQRPGENLAAAQAEDVRSGRDPRVEAQEREIDAAEHAPEDALPADTTPSPWEEIPQGRPGRPVVDAQGNPIQYSTPTPEMAAAARGLDGEIGSRRRPVYERTPEGDQALIPGTLDAAASGPIQTEGNLPGGMFSAEAQARREGRVAPPAPKQPELVFAGSERGALFTREQLRDRATGEVGTVAKWYGDGSADVRFPGGKRRLSPDNLEFVDEAPAPPGRRPRRRHARPRPDPRSPRPRRTNSSP